MKNKTFKATLYYPIFSLTLLFFTSSNRNRFNNETESNINDEEQVIKKADKVISQSHKSDNINLFSPKTKKTTDEVSIGNNISNNQIAQRIQSFNLKLPLEFYGITLTRLDLSGNYIIYSFIVDERIYTLTGFEKEVVNNKILYELLFLILSGDKFNSILYKYKLGIKFSLLGQLTRQRHYMTFEYSELRQFIKQ